MNSNSLNPRFEFRSFGQNFGYAVDVLRTAPQTKARTDVLHTYILSATNQRYAIKMCNDKLDVKVLLREHKGLERWYPYHQFAFPLTSAFLHEFLFAWLEIDLPLLRRCHYTAPQFLQELMMPNPHVRTVEVCKNRHYYTVNDCQVELGSLWIDDRHPTQTVAVKGVDPEAVLQTVALLGLQASANTNYIVGLQQLLSKDASPWVPPIRTESLMPAIARQMVFTR
jgi:hypothetical protein